MTLEVQKVILEHHNDLFTDEIEIDEIAGHFLEQEIGKIISGSPKLTRRVKGILEKALLEDESNALVDLLASESDKTTDFPKSIISYILACINEMIKILGSSIFLNECIRLYNHY